MKLFFVTVVSFFVAAQALDDKEKNDIANFYSSCTESTNADKALIMQLGAGKEVTDDRVKKYIGCMFTKLNFINSAGELQVNVLQNKIPADYDHNESVEIINKCKEVKGANVDETAFEAYKCLLKNTVAARG